MDKVKSKTLPSSLLCTLLGHNWKYEDFSNCINEDGEEYGYNACRKCLRCQQQEYFLSGWLNEKEISHQGFLQWHDF